MEGKFFRCWCDTLRHAKKIYILIKSFKIRNIEGESGESKESFDPSAFEKLYNWEKIIFGLLPGMRELYILRKGI